MKLLAEVGTSGCAPTCLLQRAAAVVAAPINGEGRPYGRGLTSVRFAASPRAAWRRHA